MPELPDLEVFKTNLFGRLTSKRLVGLEVFNSMKVRAPKQILLDDLSGGELLRIERSGKELLFDFGGGKIVAVHLMLNGEISVITDAGAGINHKIFALRFEHETIVFSDKGGLCTVRYMPPAGNAPDAFDSAFTLEYFLGMVKKKPRANIKAFLIDQNIVKGIGNAYVDEILWVARVSPHSLAGKIPEERLTALYHAIGSVLHDAVDSIKRLSPDIISGEVRSFLKVHNRTIKKTETGFKIIVERISSKITYYTEEQVAYL